MPSSPGVPATPAGLGADGGLPVSRAEPEDGGVQVEQPQPVTRRLLTLRDDVVALRPPALFLRGGSSCASTATVALRPACAAGAFGMPGG
ncbi:hypothetical protein [Kitasatospora sp. NBC_00315]|uniref:hypothetical protein n=1 Tax=Kitasatospora sp. NBC_00315 TaxID=2975963 RepID=UPI00324AD554